MDITGLQLRWFDHRLRGEDNGVSDDKPVRIFVMGVNTWTDGILRARYRNSLSEPVPLEPGKVSEVRVDLVATSNVFGAGHRIRLEVSSSNFPRFDRNTNTGGVIARETADDFQPALNRVHHGPDHPSRLILPIIRR